MGISTNYLDNLTPFARWNQIRHAVSVEVKASGKPLHKGQYIKLCKETYHDNKNIPIRQVLKNIPRRIAAEIDPKIPFANEKIRYFDIDFTIEEHKLSTPPNVWIDSSAIDGSGYLSGNYIYSITFRSIVAACNRLGIWDTNDPRLPHFQCSQAEWNENTKRFEAKWSIVNADGKPLEGFDWNPETEILETDYELPQLPPSKTEKETKEPKTPPKKYQPEVDKAKAIKITNTDILRQIDKLDKHSDKLLSKMERLEKLNQKESLKLTSKEYNDTIKQMAELRKKLKN
jgi:hypothetical protein